jgi:hypothetical protein
MLRMHLTLLAWIRVHNIELKYSSLASFVGQWRKTGYYQSVRGACSMISRFISEIHDRVKDVTD